MAECMLKHNFSPIENKESGVRLCLYWKGEKKRDQSIMLLKCKAFGLIFILNQNTKEK